MFKIEVKSQSPDKLMCDTLVLGVFEENYMITREYEILDKALSGKITAILSERPDFGRHGETTLIYTPSYIEAKRLLIVGLGKPSELTSDKIRSCSATAIQAAIKYANNTVAYILPTLETTNNGDIAKALIEGAVLGSYKFEYYKSKKTMNTDIEKVIINDTTMGKYVGIEDFETSLIIADCVNFTRDMVNHPAKYMTPTKMADMARDIAEKNGLDYSILDRDEMQKLGMHALLAVAQGSTEPPKMIVLKYHGNVDNNEIIALVGKGITFDSGGISLKPSTGMGDMKGDMAGGAAVLGAIRAIAQLKPNINIMGFIPCTENMPAGNALKPGDVISSLGGKSIEIISTDAEGRLILADAVSYALKLGATKIIDIATLTGACVVALGTTTSGIISNNDNWCNAVLTAAEECGEKMWRLPAFSEYKQLIKSDIADIKNSGGRDAGAITAGLFIAEFAGNVPWVHIDIAGTSDCNKGNGYNIKGATGVGVRTLIQLTRNLS